LVHLQVAEGRTIGLPFYSGHPALHPSGQLKLFKIDPVNFVLVTSFGQATLLSGINFNKGNKVLMQMVLKVSIYIGDLIFKQTQKREKIVVPGPTEASDRRDPL